MSEQDFPALVNYVLDATPAYKLSLIGHNESINTLVRAMAKDFYATKVDAVLGLQPCFVKTISLWDEADLYRESYEAAIKPFYREKTSVIENTEWNSLKKDVCGSPRLEENSSACDYIDELDLDQPVSVKQFD